MQKELTRMSRWFSVLFVAVAVAFGAVSSAQAQVRVITVDNTPLVSPGIDFNGFPFATMGLAVIASDKGGDFIVTEVTPLAFRGMSTATLQANFDLIAILNAPNRSDDGLGLGVNWQAAVGVTTGGCVVLSSHDPVRFHANQLPGQGLFGGGFPGGPLEPYGARELIRQAALFAGSGPQTGLLIFDDAPGFVGGAGWNNAFLNLPAVWGIANLAQAGFGDGGYTNIVLPGHPIYSVFFPLSVALSQGRFTPTSISSFSANLGDIAFHDSFAPGWNAAIFQVSEDIINAGVVDVGGFGCCTGSTIPGPDVTPITLIRECNIPVDIDIKPGSDPNSINPMNMGRVPVAILGSDTVGVMDVDPDTLAFGPSGAALAHANGPHFDDVNDDGFTDLLGLFVTKETGIAFGDTEACLTGEIDGNPFEACDDIRTVPGCGIGFELALLLPPLMWVYGRHRRRLQ